MDSTGVWPFASNHSQSHVPTAHNFSTKNKYLRFPTSGITLSDGWHVRDAIEILLQKNNIYTRRSNENTRDAVEFEDIDDFRQIEHSECALLFRFHFKWRTNFASEIFTFRYIRHRWWLARTSQSSDAPPLRRWCLLFQFPNRAKTVSEGNGALLCGLLFRLAFYLQLHFRVSMNSIDTIFEQLSQNSEMRWAKNHSRAIDDVV